MGENSLSALGDRYCGDWVLQRFLHFFAWRGQNVVYQLTVVEGEPG
jgi:hypothetical protein